MFDFNDYVENYLNKITDSWLTPRGIMFSEGFALTTAILETKSNLVLESGTAYGGSCEMMAIICEKTKILTTDMHNMYDSENYSKERLGKYPNVLCKKENSLKLFPEVLSKYTQNNVFVFIDGPKGQDAIDFADYLINSYSEKISLVAIHDIKYDSKNAETIRQKYNNCIFTDDPNGVFNSFREKIDSHMLELNKQKSKLTKSSLDREKGAGYLQQVLEETPRGFGLALIKGPFK